jgi:DNA-binding NtrC family response regulator
MAKILIADIEEGQKIQGRILESDHELFFVNTILEAQDALQSDRFDIVSVGVLFDDSQMFKLVELTKKLHATASIICVHSVATRLSFRSAEKANVAALALGACDYVDIAWDKAGNEKLQAAVKKCLGSKRKDK